MFLKCRHQEYPRGPEEKPVLWSTIYAIRRVGKEKELATSKARLQNRRK